RPRPDLWPHRVRRDHGGRAGAGLGWRGGGTCHRAQCRRARGGRGGAAGRARPRRQPGAPGARAQGFHQAAAAAGRVARGGIPPVTRRPGIHARRWHPWRRAGLVRCVGRALVGDGRAGGVRTAVPVNATTAGRRGAGRRSYMRPAGQGSGAVWIGTAFPRALDRQARTRPVKARVALAALPFATQLVLRGGELGGRVAATEGVAGLVRGRVVVIGIALEVVGLAAVLLVPVAGVGELLGGGAAWDLVAGRAHRRFSSSVGGVPKLSGAALSRPRQRVIAVLGVQLVAVEASYGIWVAPVWVLAASASASP